MTRFDAAGLATRRRQAGLTQQDIADHFGITTAAVSLWENGNALPPVDRLPGLASLMHCRIDDLFTELEVAATPAAPDTAG